MENLCRKAWKEKYDLINHEGTPTLSWHLLRKCWGLFPQGGKVLACNLHSHLNTVLRLLPHSDSWTYWFFEKAPLNGVLKFQGYGQKAWINILSKKYLYYKYYIIIILLSIMMIPTFATFYEKKAEGWHWYEPIVVSDELSQERDKEATPSPKTLKEKAGEELKAFKKDLQERLELALMYPSHAHIQNYMEIQHQMMERGELFAKRWMEVLFRTPSLDYSLKHPWSQKARHIFLEEKQKKTKEIIRSLSKSYGLFFFFEARCPYCRSFASTLKHFSLTYGWEVLAISMDGSSLKEFPDAREDNGTAEVLGVTVLPTLLAVNPQEGKVIPLSHGMNNIDHIEERIRILYEEGEEK